MNRGELAPGASINLTEISQRLAISKTPLRDALLQLEAEGFVTILPRRRCVVNVLTVDDIRNLYQVIGALEAAVVLSECSMITGQVVTKMNRLNEDMRRALDRDDFDSYYDANLQLHDCYLGLSPNAWLKRIVSTMKQRLYDFPRKKVYVKEWETRSTKEHDHLIRLIERGEAKAAADYIRDVHWSYEIQRRFIEEYYWTDLETAGKA